MFFKEIVTAKGTNQLFFTRPVTEEDIKEFEETGFIRVKDEETFGAEINVFISDADIKKGSPKLGDVIAIDPNKRIDQWLIAKEYFENNFETDLIVCGIEPIKIE